MKVALNYKKKFLLKQIWKKSSYGIELKEEILIETNLEEIIVLIIGLASHLKFASPCTCTRNMKIIKRNAMKLLQQILRLGTNWEELAIMTEGLMLIHLPAEHH